MAGAASPAAQLGRGQSESEEFEFCACAAVSEGVGHFGL